MKRYRWILFDADNTLFDYDRAEDAALSQTFQDVGLDFLPEYARLYRKHNAEVWAEFEQGLTTAARLRVERFERLFQAAGITADAQAFSQAYLPNLAKGSQLIEGAEELVKSLAGTYRLGVVTNGLTDVQRPRLQSSTIGSFFEVVVVSEEIGAKKPDVRFFEIAFEWMGQPARDEVLVVGDGLSSDIQGGNGFGLDTCWFNPGGKPPDPRYPARYEIRTLSELKALLA